MAFINILVGNQAKISVKNKQLLLSNEQNCDSFPLEDINCIILENLQTCVSTYSLSKLAEKGVVVFICDEKHLPNASLLPFNSHFNQLKVYKLQSSLSAPLRKQLWQNIVMHKIENQNECLKLCQKEEVLKDLIKKVRSDDATNIEAISASKYFRKLFYTSFTREQDNNINSALNYGYAILRSVIARNIVCHGLVPFLGLKHCNEFNNYNLADDLIEVFRPFVDLFVFENFDLKFDKEYKMQLFNLLNKNCLIGNAKYTLSYAMEIFVQSFVDSLQSESDKLKFPKLIELENHEFM